MRPIKLALIGCGRRTRTVYGSFLKQLASELTIVAVCDPVREAADAAAEFYQAKSYSSIRDLVAERPMEAALLVTPEESHHSLSVFLSRHGVPHACETPLAPTLAQAREMVAEAEKAGVLLHINEQFFRRDVLAFSRQIIATGAIGKIGRAIIHGGHGGTHDTSVLLAYAPEQKPVAVNAIQHVMPVERHKELYNRWFESEHYLLRAIHFDGGFLGVNSAANPKGALGRQSRPGNIEVHGSRGAFIENGIGPEWPWRSTSEVRITSDEDLGKYAYAKSYPLHCHPFAFGKQDGTHIPYHGDIDSLSVELPLGTMIYKNPTWDRGITNTYFSSVALATLDFVRAVRGEDLNGFNVRDALLAAEIEAGFELSADQNGARIELPLSQSPRSDAMRLEELKKKYGVDPLHVDAMVDVSFPKSYAG